MGERLQQLVQPNTAISVLLTEDGEMMRKIRQEGEVVVDIRAVVKGEQSRVERVRGLLGEARGQVRRGGGEVLESNQTKSCKCENETKGLEKQFEDEIKALKKKFEDLRLEMDTVKEAQGVTSIKEPKEEFDAMMTKCEAVFVLVKGNNKIFEELSIENKTLFNVEQSASSEIQVDKKKD